MRIKFRHRPLFTILFFAVFASAENSVESLEVKEVSEVKPVSVEVPVTVPTEPVSLESVALETVPSPTPVTQAVTDKKIVTSSVPLATMAPVLPVASAQPQVVTAQEAKAPEIRRSHDWNGAKAWYNQTLGWVDSKWGKMSNGTLRNGSMTTGILVTEEVMPQVEWGLGINWIRGGNNNGNNDDMRTGFELKGNAKYKLNESPYTSYFSLGLSYGSFQAWKAIATSDSQITFNKYAGGTLGGLSPGVGFMGKLYGSTRFELTAEYSYYFGKSAKYVGGLAVIGGIGISFQ